MASATRNSPTAILELDLKGAFDHVKHTAISFESTPSALSEEPTSNTETSSQTDKATLNVRNHANDLSSLGVRGTPPRAVLCPLLFNIALLGIHP